MTLRWRIEAKGRVEELRGLRSQNIGRVSSREGSLKEGSQIMLSKEMGVQTREGTVVTKGGDKGGKSFGVKGRFSHGLGS